MEFDLSSNIDLFLVPAYVFFLAVILNFIKKKNPNNPLIQKYLLKGFYAKIIGGVLYALLVLYFWQIGDTLSYFRETLEIRQLLAEGKISFYQIFFYDYEYFKETYDLKRSVNDSGFMVVKFSLVLSYFSFSRFLVTTILMATIAYAGLFKLFETFVYFTPSSHRIIAAFVLFFPSIFLYGSGILKDTICMSALGWFYYAMHQMVIRKNFKTVYFLIAFLSFYFIFVVKIYIIAAFVPCYIVYLIIILASRVKNTLLKVIALPLMITLISLLYITNAEKIDKALGAYSLTEIQGSIEGLQKSYMDDQDAGSNFDLGTFEPTLSGMIKKIPAGITAALYRPFFWEIKKPIMLITGLESLFILFFTLLAIKMAGPKNFVTLLFTNAEILLFIGFSVMFAGLVGLSTLNFGTLARYRISAIPFYLMGLLLIIKYSKKNVNEQG